MPRRLAGWLLLLTLGLLATPGRAEQVELFPDERASWRLRNLLAFLRPNHFLGERRLEVETTPPGATLELFYVRAGFQKRYEQATAPATILLPRRVDAGPRDSVTVRASLDGYRQQTVRVPVESSQSHVVVELAPLPNQLRGVSHTYFAGRASLAFLLKEAPTVRVQDGAEQGFSVILAETARSPEAAEGLAGIQSPIVREIEAQQLGEDLLVRVALASASREPPLELRSRQSHDAIRSLHRFVIDLVPSDEGAAAVERVRSALARLEPADLAGCADAFDAALRAELDAAALARALRPRGEFVDPFLRAALRRLGELAPDRRIHLVDGSRYRADVPLELAAAANQAAQAQGYLALLDRLVARLEPAAHRAETLRSLIAPELDPARFEAAVARARGAEARCRGTPADRGDAPGRLARR